MRHKTNVSFENVYYSIDNEKKVVVCRIMCDLNISNNHSKIVFLEDYYKKKFPFIRGERFWAKGIARCNPKDTFDETIGKRIAESRAKKEAYSVAANVYNFYSKILESEMVGFKMLVENNSIVAEREKEHIKKLIE